MRREGPHVLVLSNVHYVHARARYILLSHDSQALSRVWRKTRFLEHSTAGGSTAGAWALESRQLVSFSITIATAG